MYCSVRLYHTKQETTALPQPACDCACAGGSKWCPEDCLTVRFCGLNLQSNGCIELVGIRHFYDFFYVPWSRHNLWMFMRYGLPSHNRNLDGYVNSYDNGLTILQCGQLPKFRSWHMYVPSCYPQLMLGWKVDETMDSYAFAYPLLASKLVNNQTRCGRHLSMNLNLGIDWHNIDVMWWCLIGIGSPKTILRFNNQLQDGIEKTMGLWESLSLAKTGKSFNKQNQHQLAGSVASNHGWLSPYSPPRTTQ